jgi:hypothetical protein
MARGFLKMIERTKKAGIPEATIPCCTPRDASDWPPENRGRIARNRPPLKDGPAVIENVLRDATLSFCDPLKKKGAFTFFESAFLFGKTRIVVAPKLMMKLLQRR